MHPPALRSMFSPGGRQLQILICTVFALTYAARTSAQTPSPFVGRVGVSKATTVRQTSATAVQDEGSILGISASFSPENTPAEFSVELRGPNGSFELARTTVGLSPTIVFVLQRPFSDRQSMEQAFPDGTYTLVCSKGSFSVAIEMNPAITAARVTNLDTLQRWDGSSNLSVTLSPTPNGLENGAAFSLYLSGTVAMAGSATLTSPSTTISTNTPPYRMPNTSPGQLLDGEIILRDRRSLNGGTTQPSLDLGRDYTLHIPVARAHVAPQITTQPIAQTVNAGSAVTLSVVASGNALSYLWLKDAMPIAGATGATLSFAAAQVSDSGLYTAVVMNTGGTTASTPARLTVNAVTSRPTITTPPTGAALFAGMEYTLSVVATGTPPLSYQWLRDGIPVTGATAASLAFPMVRLADAGEYTVTIANSAGTVSSEPVLLKVGLVSLIANLSIRTRVGGDNGILTVGFSVARGDAATQKPLLIRAVGPTLSAFGVDAALPDPRIEILSGASLVGQNDDWDGSAQISTTAMAVGAFPLVYGASKDSALISTLVSGSYTVRVIPAPGTSGVALAEVYDATSADAFFVNTPRLVNVSALAQVGTGGDILIAGFAIAGTGPKTVLVRGIGPTLATFGVVAPLADPKLEIYANGASAVMAANDDWGDANNAPEIARVFAAVGAFGLAAGAKDAALLLTLRPGSYTAQLSGKANASGMALVEVYEVP